jgi:hypothetical protein
MERDMSSEETSIAASFVLTFDEMKMAQAAYSPRSRFVGVIFLVVVVLGLSPIITGVLSHRIRFDFPDWSIPNMVILVIIILGFYIFLRYQQAVAPKKAFAQNPVSNKRIDCLFSREMLISKVEGVSETKIQWSSLVQAKRTKMGFIFFQSPQVYFWIPEHAFQSKRDADAVAELTKEFVPSFIES